MITVTHANIRHQRETVRGAPSLRPCVMNGPRLSKEVEHQDPQCTQLKQTTRALGDHSVNEPLGDPSELTM